MKKKLLNLVLALTLVVAGMTGIKSEAKAADDDLSYSWNVTYDGKSFSSTYNKDAAVIKNVMPGDTVTYSVKYINGTNEATEFYMNADVLKSLEEGSKAEGGAYSFKITNNDSVIFDSELVGGDVKEAVGLNQVSGKQGAYFTLGTVDSGANGEVKVLITLDGNSQTNQYMASIANLEIKFGAESASTAKYSKKEYKKVVKTNSVTKYVPNVQKKSIVKDVVKTLDNGTDVVVIDDDDVPLAAGDNPRTGDSLIPLMICGAMLAVGLSLIIWYAAIMINKKKEVA